MANTKNYSIRERVLDRYLSSGEWYSRIQLEDFCNKALRERGENPITSRTTIQNDLIEIENKYQITIERKRKGRTYLYKYKDSGFSIYSSELTEKDFMQLTGAMEVLRRFEGMPQFEWIEELDVRINTISSRNGEGHAVVGFENNLYSKGMEHFAPLFKYIRERIAIDISYKGFKMNEAKRTSISPYYLKQYNNRWFLFGKTLGYSSIGVYPLDRILSIGNAGREYEPCDIDFEEYFEDVVGVSKPKDVESVKVEIWFSNEQLKYIETKPIHGSQRIVQRDDAGGIVELDVILNYELEQLLLSFGEKARVLSPNEFREKVKARIAKSLENY